MKTIILVSVGILQEYIIHNIEQLLELQFKNIHIITEKKYFTQLSKYESVKLVDADSLNIDSFKNIFTVVLKVDG